MQRCLSWCWFVLLWLVLLAQGALIKNPDLQKRPPTCEFKFFPDAVDTDTGPRQLTMVAYGKPRVQPYTDPLDEKRYFSFSLVARILSIAACSALRWY